ncbi:hypothetical protein RDV89_15670 [Nocardioides zeae]|uniref:TPM domain-containing protein n=1 Tax=Nocardioides imazamoxiresistens TaxID=3231893 RepID=A0ABU3PZ33_9ACTN|nr:hypothetical protein [Nocardioides zeae]MDT9594523.1 hypothetical protein [Nocardioides zeae]
MNGLVRRLAPTLVGLVCGVLACLAVVGRFDGSAPSTRDDLVPGDVVQDALDAFADGDHVVVAPGSSAYLSPEDEAALEQVIDQEQAPMFVLVVEESWNAGYRQAGHAFDQMMANATVDGLLVLWEQSPDGTVTGQVRLSGDRPLPPSYQLEEQGFTLTPEEASAYEAIEQYEMLGDAGLRMTEWARALPDGIEDVVDERRAAQEEATGREDTVFGVVAGVFVGLFGGFVVWVLIGLLRRRTGRTFLVRAPSGASRRRR